MSGTLSRKVILGVTLVLVAIATGWWVLRPGGLPAQPNDSSSRLDPASAPRLVGRTLGTPEGSAPSAAPPPTPPPTGTDVPPGKEPKGQIIVRLRMPDGSVPERAAAVVSRAPAGSANGHRIGMGLPWTAEEPILTLPLGNWVLQMRVAEGGLWQSAPRAISLESSAPPVEVAFDLAGVTCLRGTITSASGEVAWLEGVALIRLEDDEEARVDRLVSSPHRVPIEGRTDTGGQFTYEDLEPGRYLVGARRTMRGSAIASRVVASCEVYVPIEGSTIELVVPPVPPAEYVLVTVLGPGGEPVGNASFRVEWEGPSGGGSECVVALPCAQPLHQPSGHSADPASDALRASAGGCWRLLGPAPDQSDSDRTAWWIEVQSPSFGVKRVPYDPSAGGDVHIQYESAPCRLEVQVHGVSGTRYATRLHVKMTSDAGVSLPRPVVLTERGEASLGPVQPGEYDLALLLGNRSILQQVVALHSGLNQVRLTLPPLYEVTLQGIEGRVIVTRIGGDSERTIAVGRAVDGRVLVDGLLAGTYRAQWGSKSVEFQRPGPDTVPMD